MQANLGEFSNDVKIGILRSYDLPHNIPLGLLKTTILHRMPACINIIIFVIDTTTAATTITTISKRIKLKS